MKKRPVTLRVQILSALLFLTLTATLTVSFAAWHVCRNKSKKITVPHTKPISRPTTVF